MKILLLHNRYRFIGGEERVIAQLEYGLKRENHDVVKFEVDSNDWKNKCFLTKLVNALSIPYSLIVKFKLIKLIRAYRPDVIHVHNIFPFLTPSVYAAANAQNIPVVQTLHNYRIMCINGLLFRDGVSCNLCLTHNLMFGFLNRCYQSSCAKSFLATLTLVIHKALGTWNKRISRYIALSNFSMSKFVSAGIDESKIVVIRNAVEPAADGDLSPIRLRIGFVYIGRLSHEKGVHLLIKAYEKFCDEFPGIPLHVIGTGPLMADLENLSKHCDRLVIHGYLDRLSIQKILGQVEFLLFPSLCYENCPNVILEALSSGVPIIAANTGGVSELVQENCTGWLFEPGSSDAMIRTMYDAVSNKSGWQAMSQACIRQAQEHHSLDNWISKTVCVYQQVLEQ